MKKNRIITALFLLFALTFTAFAQSSFSEGIISQNIDGSTFSSGQTAGSNADINGILLAAGYNVNAGGSGEHAMLAGYSVNLTGDYEKDVFAAGKSVNISGFTGRDTFIAGNAVTISGTCQRNVFIAASNVIIGGKIGGDVYISADQITISSTAEISGQLHYNSDAKIGAPAFILSDADVTPSDTDSQNGTQVRESAKDTVLGKLKSGVSGYLGLILVAFMFLWITPLWKKIDGKYTGAPFSKYACTFGIGFAVLAGVPLASIILMITGIGIRAALILLFTYAALIAASPIIIGFIAGSLILRRAFKLKPCYYSELALGLAIYKAVSLIPVLSFICGVIAIPFGVGAFVLLLRKHKTFILSDPMLTANFTAINEDDTLY